MHSRRSKSLGINSYSVTCSSRHNLIVLCWVRMHEWKAACKSKCRIPSLVNTKQNMDIISLDVFKIFLFFYFLILNIGRKNGVCINMIILACGKGNAHNKSEVLGTFKWFDWCDNTQSDKNGAHKIWNFNHHSCAPEGYLWWFGKFWKTFKGLSVCKVSHTWKNYKQILESILFE